ncbi:uncharacterized protein TRIADDRAFT_56855 [Trichoplax adhaerens]|uniref:G-protein coupled receptors family 1 profile domain-containing protein n=1 Tax=Trichoplax adhaerens TaxID=10228 RepID=B3RWS0_TRIAD|nr:hypothetical protein TRIADDRAFT_56855 [Trichoplax adhaerens]EDV24749.1 hypothetical protein TRIADDRAFT_56855 [Trichoplax adhaerens]|eukprot:XP_002112639.1 hypothetical protein TRIADDRAFT_56855 [Trichoplax adhaerens]
MVKLHLRQVPIHSSNTFWCRLQFGWIMYLHIIIVYNMLALSVTRYYVVAKSNQLPHFIKNHPNWSIFIFIWLVPLLFASPPVIGYWGKYTYAQVVGLCYPDYHYQQNIYHILYFVTYFLFVPILSLIVISVSYRMILNETREKRRKINEQTRENAVRSYIVANIFHTSEEEFIHFSREKHEKLLAKHLINICFTCICSILPLNIFMVIHFIVGTPITRKLIIIGIIFTQVANIINNFFYYLRNRENFFSFLTGNISKSNKVTCESDLT